MILKQEVVEERLKELDEILKELGRHRDVTREDFQTSLSQRWIIERGLIAAATVKFDVADHILAANPYRSQNGRIQPLKDYTMGWRKWEPRRSFFHNEMIK